MSSHNSRGSLGARLLAALLTSASAAALSPPAHAQAESATERLIAYNIPAQPLSAALLAFAQQSDVQVFFAYDEIVDLRAPALVGAHTRSDALRILLSGTDIEARVDSLGYLRLEHPAHPQREARLIEAQAPGTATTHGAREAEETEPNGDDDLVVTGTRIRGAGPVGANVLSLDREAIDQTGRSTIQDVLATLPQNFMGGQNEAAQQSAPDAQRNIGFGAAINLRGLGSDATLTLVNGRRLVPAGSGNFVDVSMVPLAAVQRVEVLADGASATYGADAIGGVVNIILQDDFDGAETNARFGADGRGDVFEYGLSHLAGWDWRSGHLTAAYEYRERTALEWNDREITSDSDLRRYAGGLNYARTQGNPGTITRIGTTNVTLGIPSGQDGTSLSEADLISGQINYQNSVEGLSVTPEQTSHALFVSFSQDIGERARVFADVMGSERRAEAGRVQASATIVVPESNYYRQLNNLFPGGGPLTMGYFFGEDFGAGRHDSTSEALTALLGFEYELSETWNIELTAGYAHSDEYVRLSNLYDTAAGLTAALASSNQATAFNPFADGSNTAQSVLDALTYHSIAINDGDIRSFGVKADGQAFELPGGPLRIALGYERREEDFAFNRVEYRATGPRSQNNQRPGQRTVDALFLEAYAPLIGPTQNAPLVRALTLSASARHEEFSDVEGATTPRFGVDWEVTSDLSVRAAWGQSFKAPRFDQLLAATAVSLAVATPAQDPNADDGSTGVLSISGANPNLEPETAETWSAGFDYRPSWLPGLRLQSNYFEIHFEDRIDSGGSTGTILRNPIGFEDFIIRDPTAEQVAYYLSLSSTTPSGTMPPDGVEIIIDTRLRNIAAWTIRGVDLSANLNFDTPLGEIGFFASATHFLEHSRQNTRTAPTISPLDTVFNPLEWRARGGASWRTTDWAASLTANYQNEYRDIYAIPNRSIDSLVTWDFRASHEFGPERGTRLSLSVQNLFDEDPPFTNNPIGFGYDPANASPLGRFAVLELRQSW